MTNIFSNDEWGDSEWGIYFSNLDRLRKRKQQSKGQFNDFVGVWNAYRRKGLLKAGRETVLTICQKFGVTEDWLGSAHSDSEDEIAEYKDTYDLHGGYKPDFEKSMGIRRGSEEWAALGMLYEIIRDNDPTYCRAIMSNLRAFTTAIRERGRRVELEAELAQVKQEQTRGREETEKLRTEIAELRAIVQIQARAATYTGPERRSGLDRRQHPGTSPDGIEHRTGIDRRTDITRNGNHT